MNQVEVTIKTCCYDVRTGYCIVTAAVTGSEYMTLWVWFSKSRWDSEEVASLSPHSLAESWFRPLWAEPGCKSDAYMVQSPCLVPQGYSGQNKQ